MTDIIATLKDIVQKIYANQLDFWTVVNAIHQLTEFLLKYKAGDLVFGSDADYAAQNHELRTVVDSLTEDVNDDAASIAYAGPIATSILVSIAIKALSKLLEDLISKSGE